MRDRDNRPSRHSNHTGNAITGLIVILIGFAFLFHQLDFVWIPHWLFTWQMILIVIGLAIGAKRNFNGIGWLVLILIGSFSLANQYFFFHWPFHMYGWPVIIIIVGVFILFRSLTFSSRYDSRDSEYWTRDRKTNEHAESYEDEKKNSIGSGEDYINITSVFGGNKKRIFSKHFKGGESMNFFGGTELDLTQADIDGKAVLDVTQMFGGVTLIVPSNWSIKSDMITILGGFSDKRSGSSAGEDQSKLLVITGTCIFGGVEIKSY